MKQKKFVIRMEEKTFEYLQQNAIQNLTSVNKLINKIIKNHEKDQEKMISSEKKQIPSKQKQIND